jgi:hypothetical protein
VVVKVENDVAPIQDAAVKVLFTFPDGRQNSYSGTTDRSGTLTYITRIPGGTSPGLGNVDIMVRKGGRIAIESSSFTVK